MGSFRLSLALSLLAGRTSLLEIQIPRETVVMYRTASLGTYDLATHPSLRYLLHLPLTFSTGPRFSSLIPFVHTLLSFLFHPSSDTFPRRVAVALKTRLT